MAVIQSARIGDEYLHAGQLSYSAYIRSDEWKAKRALVLKRCGSVCEGCGVAQATEVHHTTYYHLFDEFLFELLGLCHACHERLTAERREDLEPVEEIEDEDELDEQPL